jgi:hypothetical protein
MSSYQERNSYYHRQKHTPEYGFLVATGCIALKGGKDLVQASS